MNPTTINDYIKAGLFLIPIPPVNGKPVKGPQGPNAIGWNLPRTAGNPNGYSRDLDNLIKRTRAPGSSIGLALEPSRIAAIDLDDLEAAREALALADIDLDVLMSDPQAVRIESRPGRGKLLPVLRARRAKSWITKVNAPTGTGALGVLSLVRTANPNSIIPPQPVLATNSGHAGCVLPGSNTICTHNRP